MGARETGGAGVAAADAASAALLRIADLRRHLDRAASIMASKSP